MAVTYSAVGWKGGGTRFEMPQLEDSVVSSVVVSSKGG